MQGQQQGAGNTITAEVYDIEPFYFKKCAYGMYVMGYLLRMIEQEACVMGPPIHRIIELQLLCSNHSTA